jgi:hypothetical protein
MAGDAVSTAYGTAPIAGRAVSTADDAVLTAGEAGLTAGETDFTAGEDVFTSADLFQLLELFYSW